MVTKPARPSAARELRRLLHDSDGTTMAGMAHAIYVNSLSLFAVIGIDVRAGGVRGSVAAVAVGVDSVRWL